MTPKDGVIVATGSVFLVGEMRALACKRRRGSIGEMSAADQIVKTEEPTRPEVPPPAAVVASTLGELPGVRAAGGAGDGVLRNDFAGVRGVGQDLGGSSMRWRGVGAGAAADCAVAGDAGACGAAAGGMGRRCTRAIT